VEDVDYRDTFIQVAPDSTASAGTVPPPRGGKPTVASATFDLINSHPYRYRSSDVIFTVWADRQGISQDERLAARKQFFAQPRACVRASDLAKKLGWGIHADQDGRLALYAVESPEYDRLAAGRSPGGRAVTVKAAMGSRR
jgi:hypothetical protein